MNTKENDTRHGVTTAEYKIAEVLIFSQKNALLDLRPQHDFGVACRRRNLGQINYIVPMGAEM